MTDSQTVGKTTEIAPGTMKLFDFDGEKVVVANVEGAFCAFNNVCSHAGGPLSEGELVGDTVTCPWHSTIFNVRTGEVLEGVTDDPVPIYEVRIEGDDIKLRKP